MGVNGPTRIDVAGMALAGDLRPDRIEAAIRARAASGFDDDASILVAEAA